MKKSVPQPPKVILKSIEIDSGSTSKPSCPQILRTLIFDDDCMNFNRFSSSGVYREHPKSIKNASRIDTENMCWKPLSKSRFFWTWYPKGGQNEVQNPFKIGPRPFKDPPRPPKVTQASASSVQNTIFLKMMLQRTPKRTSKFIKNWP